MLDTGFIKDSILIQLMTGDIELRERQETFYRRYGHTKAATDIRIGKVISRDL